MYYILNLKVNIYKKIKMKFSIFKISTHLFLSALFFNNVNAVIENLNVERSVDLMEQGSNLVTF
jgi:hypothetical protein